MASLNGACIGPPASLITFLVGCMVTCENAPRTVIIPATAKTTARKLMRRFILCLPSNDPPSLPREFSPQSSLQQAPLGQPQLVSNIPFSHGLRPPAIQSPCFQKAV